MLAKEGIDHLVIVPFDETFAELSAESYIRNFLVKKIHPHTIIIGYDHHFGKDRAGNYLMLEEFGKELGFAVKEIPRKLLNEITISSTQIRKALSEGNVRTANALLGYDYFFDGKVIEGNQLGRTLGYPTANLSVEDPEKLLPGNGIYAVQVTSEGILYKGMMSIGFNPTIGDNKLSIEVNILDFDKDIYGSVICIHVKHFLRKEQKFNSLDELKFQIAKDKEETIRLLS